MIKGILFDKDGTLLDFNRTWLQAYFQASEYLARSVDRPELAHSLLVNGGYIPETGGWVRDSLLASGSNDQIMAFWGEQLGRPLDAEQISGIREIFGSAGKKPAAVLADMPGFFSELRRRGIALGVATMDDERHAHSTLGKMGIGEVFDFICGADSGFGMKPEPGMVHGFARHCGLATSQIMMVGDSPRDLNMGRNAAVATVVGVLTGAHSQQELAEISDHVFADISGITELLDN